MPIANILKKASSLLQREEKIANGKIDNVYEDNEILFCKNNVCIHPPMVARQECNIIHYPGYLTVTTKTFVDQCNRAKRSTLFLTWLPNSSLCKCPLADSECPAYYTGPLQRMNISDCQQNGDGGFGKDDLTTSADMQELRNELQPLLGGKQASLDNLKAIFKSDPITSVNITISNPQIENTNITQTYSCVVVADSERLRLAAEDEDDNNPNWMTPELLAFKHNLTFPESVNVTPTAKRKSFMKCRRFSVDLSQMRSLRLFFSDNKCTSGQLVIASRESQYKILHFHYGGLDHLAQV